MKAIALLLMLVHHLWREPGFVRFEPIAYGNILQIGRASCRERV